MGSLDPRLGDGCSLEPQLSRSTAASKRALMHLRLQNNENETLEKLLNTPPAVEHWFERTWRQSDDVRAKPERRALSVAGRGVRR